MLPGKSLGETNRPLAHCLPPVTLAVSHPAPPGLHQAAEPGPVCHPLQVVLRVDALIILFSICTYSIAPLHACPGWRKGNSNKHTAAFVPGMPLVSASLWGRLNPRKDTRCGHQPPLFLCQAQQATVPTSPMVPWFSPRTAVCPHQENKLRFHLKPNPQDVSCCYRKDQKLQDI